MVFDRRDSDARLGWKLRDVVGLSVMLVWAGLHLADFWSETFAVPSSVDNAMLVVLGWWPVGAAADTIRAVVRAQGAPVTADKGTAEADAKRDGQDASPEVKAAAP